MGYFGLEWYEIPLGGFGLDALEWGGMACIEIGWYKIRLNGLVYDGIGMDWDDVHWYGLE